MKILLMSDSHGRYKNMETACLAEKPDLVFHMGDGYGDGRRLQEAFPHIPVKQVPGNCDGGLWNVPEVLVETVDGVMIFATHGHNYGAKYGLLKLELAARERGADVVLFGHTHRAMVEQHNKLWMINPGTIRPTTGWSYGVLTLEQGNIDCRIVEG